MNRLKINKMKNNRVCIYKLKEIIMKNNRTRIDKLGESRMNIDRLKQNIIKLAGIILVIAAVSGIAGCGKSTASTEKVFYYGDTTFNAENDETDVNPHNGYSGWACIRYGVGETLFKYSDTMELEPCLAESYENVDELTWKINLKDGITFTSGRKLDGEAVKECIEHLVAVHKRAAGDLNIERVEAEIPSIMYEVFKNLGLDNFTIRMNNRKILNGLFEDVNAKEISVDVMRIIDKIEKIGEEKVRAELRELQMPEQSIEKIMQFIGIQGTTDEKLQKLENLNIENDTYKEGLYELKEVIKYIRLFNVPEEYFTVDVSIARGLDYYTGTVYETFLNDYKSIGSICSGGRYSNLSEYYTDKKMPGVGMSIGLTRLFYVLNEIGLIKTEKKSISDVLIQNR